MKKLLCYFCVLVLSIALYGCKDDGGADADSSTKIPPTSREVNIPNNFNGPNIHIKDSLNELHCKRNSASSRICCQYAKETGECKCYNCDKPYLTVTDLSSKCSLISSLSESECISFINGEDANANKGPSESKTSRAEYYNGKVSKDINTNPVYDVSKTENIVSQEVNPKNKAIQRQQVIKRNIIKYLEKNAEIINEDLGDLIDWFKDEKNNLGNELSILWLIDQLAYLLGGPAGQPQDYEDSVRFKDIENAIYEWREEVDLLQEVQEGFDGFIFEIYFLQHYPRLSDVVGPIGTASVIYEIMSSISYDSSENLLQQYKNTLSVNQDKIVQFINKYQKQKTQFEKEVVYSKKIGDTLKKGISDNALVFIKNGISDKVTAAIFKQNNSNYYYYNPSASKVDVAASDNRSMIDKLYEDFNGTEGIKKLRFFIWNLTLN